MGDRPCILAKHIQIAHLYKFLKWYNPQWAFLIRQDNTRGNQLEGDNKHFPLFVYNVIDSYNKNFRTYVITYRVNM